MRQSARTAGLALFGLLALTAQAAEPEPWWRGTVFYEIFVRSFADSTTGPLAEDGDGDLQGLIEHLDYLNDGDPSTADDLEVGGLWLMPIMPSPSYHGYDVTDYRAVEEDYGTREDFRRLVAEAHRRGIRVIVDLVINHTSRRHPWFRDAYRRSSPYHDWYLWSDVPRGYRGPWGQEVWHQLPWWQRGFRHFNYRAYYGIFWAGMPDLNLGNAGATAAIFDAARFWLEEMGVDGFRLDAVRHLIEDGPVQVDTAATHDWLRRFAAFVRNLAPEAFLVGEAWADTATVATYGPDQVDLAFQFDLAAAIVAAVRDGDGRALAAEADLVWASFPPGRFATFLTNHDQARVFSELDRDLDRAKLAATLLLTLPGVPFLYYGEEIGMTGFKPDPEIRTPMQWTPDKYAGFSRHRPWQRVNLGFRETNVETLGSDPASLLSHYRRLMRLRNRRPALATGGYGAVAGGPPQVFAFLRRCPGETLLVVSNLGGEPVADYALAPDLLPSASEEPRELLHGNPVRRPGERPGEGYRPIDELAGRTAYVIALEEEG